MKIKTHIAKRLAAGLLAGALVLGAAPQALAAGTIGGADTAQVPVARQIEQENCIRWLLDLLGLGGSKDKITVDYLNVRGQGLRRNVRMDLVDCLVGITYTELGSIGNFAEISDRAAAEAWKAQAVAIHSYLEYQNQYGSSANALTYTPVDQIPAATRRQMENAIEEVADLILVYDAGGGYSVCDAVFSCSAGYNTQTGVYGTCSAKDAWGTDVPYLQRVWKAPTRSSTTTSCAGWWARTTGCWSTTTAATPTSPTSAPTPATRAWAALSSTTPWW